MHSLEHKADIADKMKVNGPGRSKKEQGEKANSWLWAKHAWLYSDPLQASKGTFLFQQWLAVQLSCCRLQLCLSYVSRRVLLRSKYINYRRLRRHRHHHHRRRCPLVTLNS